MDVKKALSKITPTTHKLFNQLFRELRDTDSQYRYLLGVSGLGVAVLTDFHTGAEVKGNREIQKEIKRLLAELKK